MTDQSSKFAGWIRRVYRMNQRQIRAQSS